MILTQLVNIDDLLESASLKIVRHLATDYTNTVLAVEPNSKILLHDLAAKRVSLFEVGEALASADVLIVAHDQFKELHTSASQAREVLGVCAAWL